MAARALHDGHLVAFPTETVYGLGADACNADAVAGIFAAKQRPSFNPLISHVADIETAFAMGRAPGDGRRFFAVEQPAAPIELVDATGAGDAFGAGFLAAWTAAPRRAGDVEALVAALEEGVAHGTAACRQVGASAALDAAALDSARAFSRGAAEVTHYARNGGGEGDGLVEVPAARAPLP